MAVRIAGASRRDGYPRPGRIDECLGRRRSAAMVGDLEQVDVGQAFGEKGRIDLLFDIAHQQEPSSCHVTEQHDRDVVDRRPAIGRRYWNPSADRPQDPQLDLVDRQAIASGKPETDR
jgi:hypothetical protein